MHRFEKCNNTTPGAAVSGLRIPGNVRFGSLDENDAIFGASTCSPSILYTGEIFTSGFLLSN
jgi:hypothetical protein